MIESKIRIPKPLRVSLPLPSSMTSNLRLPRSSWLQSVIQGTRATSEAWQELQHQICLVIKSYIEQHAHQSHVRQILFEEVGREFCDRYFPHIPFDESLLQPPHLLLELLPQMRAQYVTQMHSALDHEWGLTAAKLSGGGASGPSADAVRAYPAFESDLDMKLLRGLEKEVTDQINLQSISATNPTEAPEPKLAASTAHAEVVSVAVAELMSSTGGNDDALQSTSYGLPVQHHGQAVSDEWLTLISIVRGHVLPHAMRSFVWSAALFRTHSAAHYTKLLEDRCLMENVPDASFSPLNGLLRRIASQTRNELFDFVQPHQLHLFQHSNAVAGDTKQAMELAIASSAQTLQRLYGDFGVGSVPFGWSEKQEPLLMALANRFYLLTGDYGARSLLFCWVIIEAFSSSREVELATTIAETRDTNGNMINLRHAHSKKSGSISSSRFDRAASPLSSFSASSAFGGNEDDEAVLEAENQLKLKSEAASQELAPHLVRLQTMVCTLHAHALPSLSNANTQSAVFRDQLMSQANKAWYQLLPARSPTVHAHISRLHEAATSATQPEQLMSQWINGTRKGAGGLAAPLQPVVLIQRWLEYCFAGFLSVNSVRFVWDQCLIYPHGWNTLLGEFACATMHLLSPVLLKARVFDEIDTACVYACRRIPVKELVAYFQNVIAPSIQS